MQNPKQTMEIGRVISEHKERYIVKMEQVDVEAEIVGTLRYSATRREDFPAVGDWVSVATPTPGTALIHQILPRDSIIARQAVGHFGEIQIIATNIDFALIIQALDRDFNLNRLERYLAICHSSKVQPIILLTKADLITQEKLTETTTKINHRIPNIPVIAISNQTEEGYSTLWNHLEAGKTYCMLGSSGVGKSTLLNHLSGHMVMKTDSISASTNKGRHVTSHRELVELDNGSFLIDNPGMREVGIVDANGGIEKTFDAISELAQECKFKDCTHTCETGCAVLSSVEQGILDKDAYASFLKMAKENAYFESSVAERRKKDKVFGKMLKNYNASRYQTDR